MVAVAIVVVVLALAVWRLLRGQRPCCYWRATHCQICAALTHPRLVHRHAWTDDEHFGRFPGPLVDLYV